MIYRNQNLEEGDQLPYNTMVMMVADAFLRGAENEDNLSSEEWVNDCSRHILYIFNHPESKQLLVTRDGDAVFAKSSTILQGLFLRLSTSLDLDLLINIETQICKASRKVEESARDLSVVSRIKYGRSMRGDLKTARTKFTNHIRFLESLQ